MTFAHPYWLLALLLWGLVPVLDRLAKPRPSTSLPVTHLGMRALRRLPATLPWLSGHGLAIMLLVLSLAGPVWQRSGPVQAEPGVAVVAVPGPGPAGWQDGSHHFSTLVTRLRQRSALLIAASAEAPRLIVPWTDRADALTGLWSAAPAAVSGPDTARAVLMASAKAPKGAWIVVLGGHVGGMGWRAVGATLSQRHQSLAVVAESPSGLPFEPAFAASLYDPDAIAALDYQLIAASQDGTGADLPVPLARWCLLGAVAVLVLNWGWRHGRWRVVAP
jgi:hypothetical protein